MRVLFAAALVGAAIAQDGTDPEPIQGCSLQSALFNDYCTIEIDVAMADYPDTITDEQTCRDWAQTIGTEYGCDIAAGTGDLDIETVGPTLIGAFPDLEAVFAALDLQQWFIDEEWADYNTFKQAVGLAALGQTSWTDVLAAFADQEGLEDTVGLDVTDATDLAKLLRILADPTKAEAIGTALITAGLMELPAEGDDAGEGEEGEEGDYAASLGMGLIAAINVLAFLA